MRCQPRRDNPVYIWLKKEQICLLCDEPSDGPLELCSACEAELPWLGGHCRICALPLTATGLSCGACLRKPPPFSRVEAAWRYAFPLDALITRFKHQAQWPLGRLLGDLLSHHLQHAFSEGLPRPDLLLPVPLSSRRLRQRGQMLSRPCFLLAGQRIILPAFGTLTGGLDAASAPFDHLGPREALICAGNSMHRFAIHPQVPRARHYGRNAAVLAK